MPKGILKLRKSNKGSVIVELDRLNGKPPMPLSYVSFTDTTYNDKDCEFNFDNGKVTAIFVNKVQVYPLSAPIVNVVTASRIGSNQSASTGTMSHVPDSLNIEQTRLPKDVRFGVGIREIDNFNLKFNRAARYLTDKDKFYFYKNDYRKSRDGRETGDSFFTKPNYGNLNFNQISKRLENQAKIFGEEKYKKIELSPDWRMILGIGTSSVYEVGMTLHHIYGIPYIPASAIKGLVRSWVIQNCFGNTLHSESNAFKESKLLCDIFGCPENTTYKVKKDSQSKEVDDDYQEFDEYGKEVKLKKQTVSIPSYYKIHEKQEGFAEKQGEVIFFDAFPLGAPQIEVDIMNVHYPDYYNGKTPPTDFQSPNPIHFLTVGKETKFQTFIGIKENSKLVDLDKNFNLLTKETALTGESKVLEFVETWLKKALTEHGIGAKTAVGYGYMQ